MNYHNITYDDMLNGDGLRVVLWVAGCSHHCKGCHNLITWNPDSGLKFTTKTLNELIEKLKPPHISGLTLSGGDPLYTGNRETIERILKIIKRDLPYKSIWLYTGYEWEDIKYLDIVKMVDVAVVGEFKEELKDINYHWAGSKNQRVIDAKKSLEKDEVILYES